MFRRSLLPLLVAALFSPLRLAAGEKPLVVWAMGEEGKKIADMARRFERANPGVTVETQAIPWEAAHAKLLTAVVGGIPPDVSQIGTTWMAEFAAMGALNPLDQKAAGSATANPDAFFPGSLQTCRVDGVLYGIPWYVDTRVLFYRKDLLASVGYPDAPATWDDLVEAARRLAERKTADGKKVYGLSLGSRGWTELLTAVWQNGGDPLRPSEREFLEAVMYYRSFFVQGLTPTKEGADVDIYHAFRTGYLPMFISGPWMVELVGKELPELAGKWGVALLPGKKTHTSFVGGSNLVIFKESKKKELAFRFLEFMSDPRNQVEWMRATNDLPSVKAAWQDPFFADKPMIQVFGKQMFDTASPPTVPEWEQIASATEDAMEKIVLNPAMTSDQIQLSLQELETLIIKLRVDRSHRPGSWKNFLWWALGGAGLLLAGLYVKSFWDLRIRHIHGEEPPFRLRDFLQRDLVGIFFVLPAVSLLLVFMFFPMAVSFIISLTDLNIFSINEWTRMQFIGIENYGKIVQDPVFWHSLWNTLYFTGVGVPLTVAVSLLAAVALNQRTVKLKPLFRMSFFAPVVTTAVAVAVVWRWLYNPDFGVFNWFLQSVLGLKKIFWLSDPRFSLPSLILMAIWKNFGYNMVIFLAGLQTIPESQYEAARIDGASSWQCFRYITIPGLTPTLLFVFIMTTIGYLQFFAEPYVMTKGGPLDSTTSIVLYMYNQGFRFFNLGYASAISYTLFGLIFVFTFFQMRLKKSGFEVFV